MAAPLPSGHRWPWHVLRFIDVLEDSDPTKLSWTKIGVAWSTLLSMATGGAAAVQAFAGDIAHTDWQAFALSIGLHGVTKTAHEIKRRTEKSNGNAG